MHKVKLIKYVDDYEFGAHVTEFTDWEEVDDKEYQLLTEYVYTYNKKATYHFLALITDVGRNCVRMALSEMKEKYKKELELIKEQENKKQEKEAKRKATLAAKKKEKELKQLQELKAKYE